MSIKKEINSFNKSCEKIFSQYGSFKMREQWPKIITSAKKLPPAEKLTKNLPPTNLVILVCAQNENDSNRLQKSLALVFDYIFQFSLDLKLVTVLEIIPEEILESVIFPFLYQADSRGKNSCFLSAKLKLKINPDAFIHFLSSRTWEQSELINLYFLIPEESKNQIIQLLEEKQKNTEISDTLKETINEFRFIIFDCPNSEPLIPDTPPPPEIENVKENDKGLHNSIKKPNSNGSKLASEKPIGHSPPNLAKPPANSSSRRRLSQKNKPVPKEDFPLTALGIIFCTTLFILFFIYHSYSNFEPQVQQQPRSAKIPDFWIDAVTQKKITPEFLKADKDYRMGELFLTREKYSEAVILFEDALAAYPKHIKAQFRVGFCRLNLGHYQGAKTAFNKALKIDNNFKLANLFLARTALAQQNTKEAQKYYKRELKINKNPQIAIEFAQFLKKSGKPEKAESILKEFQDLYPEKGYISTSLTNSPLMGHNGEKND